MKIVCDTLWIKVSGVCNLGCIGCRGEGRFTGQFTSIDEIRQMLISPYPIREINLTGNGEALLHPQIDEVVGLCREIHPEAVIWLISNGTIPIKGRVRDAIIGLDKIGLSIDGATKETYEHIRVGAIFERFIENTLDVVSFIGTGYLKSVEFCFTATTLNLRDLSGIVTLASQLGVNKVWAQPMEESLGLDSNILLFKLHPVLLAHYIELAKAEAERLGVVLTTAGDIYPGEFDIRKCRFLWKNPGQIQPVGNEYLILPCCWMSPRNLELIADQYNLRYSVIPTMDEIYNSAGYWKLRNDLLDGLTQKICGNCQASRGYV